MASMRHLKDALKGTRERLERAEALLDVAFTCINACTDWQNERSWSHAHKTMNKIQKYRQEPLDTSE